MEQINTEALKKKILDLAIRGKLVEQDPNDEPASVLLERIREEKEELIKQKKIKRSKNESYIFKGDDGFYYEKFFDGSTSILNYDSKNELPEGWSVARIQHLLTQYYGGGTPLKSIEKYWNGEIPWASIKDIKGEYLTKTTNFITIEGFENSSANMAYEGDLIIASRINVGKIIKVGLDTSINQDLKVIKINSDVLKEYFYFLFQTIKFKTKGTTVKGISNDEFLNKIITIPPIEEQKRIINKINLVFSTLNQIDLLQSDLKSLKLNFKNKCLTLAMQGKLLPQDPTDEPASILITKIKEEKEKLITEGKIKPNKNESTIVRRGESYYELIGNKEIDITDKIPYTLPSTWKWIKLNEIFEVRRGASPRPIKDYITKDSGINWIKIGDTSPTSKYITKANDKITFSAIKKTRLVNKGDLLLSNSMSFGRPYILKIDGAIHDGWLQLAPLYSNFSLDFLYYVLYSEVTKKQLLQVASGTAVKNLNSKKVEVILLPMAPINEQNRIVKKIEAILQV